MEVVLRNITVQLGTSGITYTLSQDPHSLRYSFVCDTAAGNATLLEARDAIGANHEMRQLLQSRHNEVLLPSVFWFVKKGDDQVEVTVNDVKPQLISVWVGGLDDEVAANFHAAITKSGRYRAALHGGSHIHVELKRSDGHLENRYQTFIELLKLLEL